MDKKGNLEKIINPIKSEFSSEFRKRDILQILIGAAILSVPVGFTEETWQLGENLPMLNIFLLMAFAILFISVFVYFHYHRHHNSESKKHQIKHFITRVLMTYIISFIIVGILLSTINVAPWTTNAILAFKRTVIVTFPSSMSAVVADVLK